MVPNNLDEAINNICEASGCQALATEKLSVTAGPFGVITLEICPACVTKFADRKRSQDQLIEQQSWFERSPIIVIIS
jgi:hypothetical protein